MDIEEIGYSECIKGPLKRKLCANLDALDLYPTASQVSQLARYLEQLARWNKVYNLTAVKTLDEMLTIHMFDCLAIIKDLREKFTSNKVRVLDVGTGAGLPAFVIAALNPEWSVTAVDAVKKKIVFLEQQAQILKITNLHPIHKRVENITECYDLIISRAFSSLNDFVVLTEHALTHGGLWCAMKGKYPLNEIRELPDTIDMFHVKHINVPNLDAQRCLVWMKRNLKIPKNCE